MSTEAERKSAFFFFSLVAVSARGTVMAEGLATADLTMESEEAEDGGQEGEISSPIGTGQPAVRPKEKPKRTEEPELAMVGAPPAGKPSLSSNWRNSAVGAQGRGLPLGQKAHARPGWRERKWMEEDEQEWSYSTGLGSTTFDVLRERFGEASF